MSLHSTAPTVKKRIVELLKNRPEITGANPPVLVTYARDATGRTEQMFFFGARAAVELPVMRAGRKPRQETYELLLAVDVATPGRTAEQSEERAFELLGVVEDVLADDPHLGLLPHVSWARLSGWEDTLIPEGEGFVEVKTARIEVSARLT